ncbi:general substrate transporter [Ilyonectria sp. MPI-CAGE-AT-0026]|nr:general substrate transporter [Ilyonectria sp. MPI-CAGE-AT-0026]
MGVSQLFTNSVVANYGRAVRSAPREMVTSRSLITSTLLYAMASIPLSKILPNCHASEFTNCDQAWDQGSSSVITSLPGFQQYFNIDSSAKDMRNFIAIIYIGYAVGAALSFFINDRIGRVWSWRLYASLWILGQMVHVSAPGWPALYAARIISGMGIGSLSVMGPMSIVEIAPREIRGLLTAWYVVAMGISLFVAIFCVYGVFLHVPASRLQYQIVWFSPCVFMALCIVASFFLCESPRWLLLVNRREEGIKTLVKLRGLPLDHPRVREELQEIESSLRAFTGDHDVGAEYKRPTFLEVIKETFTVRSNLRRLQQTLISFALAQLSGANSITSYFIPIMEIIGYGTKVTDSMFLSGMYGLAKFFFSLIASFFLIDTLGRRKSLFLGITLQLVSHIYIGIYIKTSQEHAVSVASSQAAIAALFIHAFGYGVGLLILPYVFGGELWPNRIRSFGGAVGQTFHWLFIYAIKFSIPSLLAKTDNWGAFIFFAGWCFIALLYVYFVVPEVAGLSVEEIGAVLDGPWFKAYKHTKRRVTVEEIQGQESHDGYLMKSSASNQDVAMDIKDRV